MAAPDSGRTPSPWAAHRPRAAALRVRYPFAADVLGLYLALLDVWEEAWYVAHADRPEPHGVARWTAERVLPQAVKATEAAGPEALAQAARGMFDSGGLEQSLIAMLAGEELPPVARFLARASLYAPLLALGADAGAACVDDPSPRGDRRCPCCGGPPQLSYRRRADDRLVSGARHLVCGRCGHAWGFSGSTCPSCGETSGASRTLYAERRAGPTVGRDEGNRADAEAEPAQPAQPAQPKTFPHLRIEACASCERYLIDVDLGRDNQAVPDVDELVALPLDLYATELGLSKITPNLMGF